MRQLSSDSCKVRVVPHAGHWRAVGLCQKCPVWFLRKMINWCSATVCAHAIGLRFHECPARYVMSSAQVSNASTVGGASSSILYRSCMW